MGSASHSPTDSMLHVDALRKDGMVASLKTQ